MITGDEKFYNALQVFDWYYMDEKHEYQYVKKYINSKDKVLDVGCGKGAFAKNISTPYYVGLDFSENAKVTAAKNGIKIENELIQIYADKNTNRFDVVVSFQVLEHVADPKSFIESSIRALKKNGKLIVAIPSEDSFLKYTTNDILNMPPHHMTRWCDETLMYIAKKYSLDVVDIYHERVQDVHKKEFLKTFILSSLIDVKLVNRSVFWKIINRISSLLSRFLIKGVKSEMLPNGHVVIAVFKKKGIS